MYVHQNVNVSSNCCNVIDVIIQILLLFARSYIQSILSRNTTCNTHSLSLTLPKKTCLQI